MNKNEECCAVEKELKVTNVLMETLGSLRMLDSLCNTLDSRLNGNKPCESCGITETKYEEIGILALSKQIAKRSNELAIRFEDKISKI